MKHFVLTILMALRNLGRNKRRTLSTLLAITVGLVGLTFLDGYITYSMWGLKETIIHSGTGHIQVATTPAFFDEGENDPFPFMFDKTEKLMRELRRLPEVKDVVPVLAFYAVLNVHGKMETVQVKALPTKQSADNLGFLDLVSGKRLDSGKAGQIVVGTGLATKLGLKIDESVSIFALSQGGGVNNQPFKVAGTVTTRIAALDAASVYMDLQDAQKLAMTTSVPLLVVYLEHTEDTAAVLSRWKTTPPQTAPAGTVFKSWEELSPYYQLANGTYQMILGVARLIVLLVSLFSISGTLTLAVLERLREVGTLRAFGNKRRQVLSMFVWEGIFLGIGGAAIGIALGWALTGAANLGGGITMPAQPGMSASLTIYFSPSPANYLSNGFSVVIASVIGAFFPGFFATRRAPAELLRAV